MDSKDKCEDGQAHLPQTDKKIVVRMGRPTFLRRTARIGVRMDRPTAKAGARDGQIPLPYMDNKERC